MNIKITYDWLLEYLETDADPYEIQKYLSLCGPSVEKVTPLGDDYVFEIEITSNRIDAASVFGIAQECMAILPQFGKKAAFKVNPFQEYLFSALGERLPKQPLKPLRITIEDPRLCSRIGAIVLTDVVVKPSPEFIKKRLERCAIRSINNLVDISNYLMLALGQPTHVFDWEKIASAQMTITQSRGDEKVTTLDGKTITLPGGDIIIKDGKGAIDGVAGIMGGADSAVSAQTKNVILFIETYNPVKIRQTAMTTGQRTVAASYFEKGLDEARVEPTLVYGVELLTAHANAIAASPIYDIYPAPQKPRSITVSVADIKRLIGVNVETKRVTDILTALGFEVKILNEPGDYSVTPPASRQNDIQIREDVIEEIVRIYGYANLPSLLQITDLPQRDKQKDKVFLYTDKIKYFLKHLGFAEMYNYSLISKEQIANLNLDFKNHLKLQNPVSEELTYLRTSLVPSLLKNIADNQSLVEDCRFFEIGNVYRRPNDVVLPQEMPMLAAATTTDFFDLKGAVEALFDELKIRQPVFKPEQTMVFLSKRTQAKIGNLGWIGQLTPYYQARFKIRKPVFLAAFNLTKLIDEAQPFSSYTPTHPYSVVKLDLTLTQKEGVYFKDIENKIKSLPSAAASIQKTVELIDVFGPNLTLRFHFSSNTRNLTLEEAKKELAKIKASVTE